MADSPILAGEPFSPQKTREIAEAILPRWLCPYSWRAYSG